MSNLQVGDVKHIHGANSHAILVVRKTNQGVPENAQEVDRDKLMKDYLNQQYSLEKNNVINYLRSHHSIEYKPYSS